MSPVPLTKQLIAGMSTLKSLGEPSERAVDPTTASVLGLLGRQREVIMICGMWYSACKIVMAVFSASIESILMPESSLSPWM